MAKHASVVGFLTLLLVYHSVAKYLPPPQSQYISPPSQYLPPPQPQNVQPPQSQYLQPPQDPQPPPYDLGFLFNVMNILDPSTIGLSVLANPARLVDAVPRCYNQHQVTFDGLRDRVLSQPNRCFPQSVDKLMDHVSDTFMKTMKAYVKLTDFVDNPKGKNDIFGLMQFVSEEKQLAMEILDHVNFIVDASYGLLGSPNCVVDEAVDVYGEYQGKFNEALTCVQEHVSERPRNLGFK